MLSLYSSKGNSGIRTRKKMYSSATVGYIFKLSDAVYVVERFEIGLSGFHFKQLGGSAAQQFHFQVAELKRGTSKSASSYKSSS